MVEKEEYWIILDFKLFEEEIRYLNVVVGGINKTFLSKCLCLCRVFQIRHLHQLISGVWTSKSSQQGFSMLYWSIVYLGPECTSIFPTSSIDIHCYYRKSHTRSNEISHKIENIRPSYIWSLEVYMLLL